MPMPPRQRFLYWLGADLLAVSAVLTPVAATQASTDSQAPATTHTTSDAKRPPNTKDPVPVTDVRKSSTG